jgi:GntR family transcriptional regulator, arabinose operon transcriptional repressor
MNSSNESRPLYQQIYDYLKKELDEGRLKSGDRVPSEKELSLRFKVSRITSKRALEMFAERGIVERVPGKGSFVAKEFSRGESARGGGGKTFGFVYPEIGDAFGSLLLGGVMDECVELGYGLLVTRTKESFEKEKAAIEGFLERGVDGVLVLPVHGEYYNPVILRLVVERFPLVLVDRRLAGLAASSIGTDNIEAARVGVDHLISLGHRAIAFVSQHAENTSAIEERLEGFVRSHADHGILADNSRFLTDLPLAECDKWRPESFAGVVERVAAFLLAHSEVTAVFADEYLSATIVMEAARRIGKRIPEALSLICFDSQPHYAASPRITHLMQNEYQMGRQAVQMLHARIGRDVPDIEKVYLPASLVVGATTAQA